MKQAKSKKDIIKKLQSELLLMHGYKPAIAGAQGIGLGPIEAAFPNAVFPTGAIHEFLCSIPECAAASGGFIAGLMNILMQKGGACLYISRSRKLFPGALKAFGVEPDQVIFIDLEREKDVLWAMKEALKCNALAAVIGEVQEISFAQSRRLQLAIEKSKVTGFILRTDANKIRPTACVARWQITPLISVQKDDMPGIGFPQWQVELLRVQNGNPGSWKVEWGDGCFQPVLEKYVRHVLKQKTG